MVRFQLGGWTAVFAGVAAVLLVVTACGSNDAPASPTRPSNDDHIRVLAPIESIEVLVAESFPPQYFLQVVSGLPNSCITFDEITVDHAGEALSVTVTNLAPADPSVVCAQVYGTVSNSVALGSSFEAGVRYTVVVNDAMTTSFVAQ